MGITTDITKGVKVTVETEYQQDYSNPVHKHYVFTYQITIENLSDHTVQLLSRHWDIVDITFARREVEGEGVVGKQPILEPGQTHKYVSGCNIQSGYGKMSGFYTMQRQFDGKLFQVNIPAFDMIVPFKNN